MTTKPKTDWRKYALAMERYASELERHAEWKRVAERYSHPPADYMFGSLKATRRPARKDYAE